MLHSYTITRELWRGQVPEQFTTYQYVDSTCNDENGFITHAWLWSLLQPCVTAATHATDNASICRLLSQLVDNVTAIGMEPLTLPYTCGCTATVHQRGPGRRNGTQSWHADICGLDRAMVYMQDSAGITQAWCRHASIHQRLAGPVGIYLYCCSAAGQCGVVDTHHATKSSSTTSAFGYNERPIPSGQH